MTDNSSIYDFYNYEFMELGIGASPNKDLYQHYLYLAKTQNQKKVLEIGYGSGLLTKLLLDNHFDVIAIDKSTEAQVFLERKCQSFSFYGKLNIENIDILQYEPNIKFNLICATDEFMNHFLSKNELEIFLSRINSLLNVNGVFITDIRKKQEDDIDKFNQYPIYTFDSEVNGIKHINCISWNTLTKDNIILVHFKYEEINSKGEILKSYIRILKHSKISFEELRILASKNNLSLSIKEEANLDCHILQFTKIK